MTTFEERDARGYSSIHRAFEARSWTDIKKAVDEGANLQVIAPSGASLEEFARGLQVGHLYKKLQEYAGSRL